MNKALLKQMVLSDKSFFDISTELNCSVDELIDKIDHKGFNTKEMTLLTDYIPIINPTEIFFGNGVDEMATNTKETIK